MTTPGAVAASTSSQLRRLKIKVTLNYNMFQQLHLPIAELEEVLAQASQLLHPQLIMMTTRGGKRDSANI